MEFNDSGDVCMECGVFDFLPGTCPRCQQTFCRDHMATHHRNLPSLTVLLAGDVAAQLEALPLCGDANPSEGPTVPHTDADPTAAGRPSCYSCGQQWCVLSPCEQCGERFCPVHRFHEHGEDKKGMTQTTKGRSEPVPPSPGEESTTTHALCQPYTVANPVVLAPSDYKSRMMACSFFVLDRSTSSSAVELGVCSASVATESSVGQIIERWMDRVLPNRRELTASVSLYTVRAAKNPAVKVPQVTLEPFTSLGTIMREALASFDSLLVCLPPVEEEEARQYVQTLLFSSSPQLLQVRKDPRVRSLTAKLYISSQKRIKPEEPTVVDTAQPEDATPSVKEKTALSSAGWPFKSPPPLYGHTFSNTKASPAGLQQAGPGRVVVALYMEDRDEPKGALAPFCMALGKEWSIGKVKDRLREERGHLLSDASRYTSLFLLSTTGNDTMTRLADTSKVSSAGIKDGSVLWWTPSAEGNAELQAEVDRLKGLKGKEGAELKMNMMKKCAVM